MANILLDYDGTIHDSAKIYVPAFRKGYKFLTDNDFAPKRECNDEDIVKYLGFSPMDTWQHFMPGLTREHRDEVISIVGKEMHRITAEGKSALYEGAEEALIRLKDMGHTLIFLSNCLHEYMEVHRKAHNLDRFYDSFFCGEDYDFAPKTHIFKSICRKFDGDFVIVGDHFFDLEIARLYGYPGIGCAYGFGARENLDAADIIIENVSEMPEAVERLLK